jgi:hypothetical protein
MFGTDPDGPGRSHRRNVGQPYSGWVSGGTRTTAGPGMSSGPGRCPAERCGPFRCAEDTRISNNNAPIGLLSGRWWLIRQRPPGRGRPLAACDVGQASKGPRCRRHGRSGRRISGRAREMAWVVDHEAGTEASGERSRFRAVRILPILRCADDDAASAAYGQASDGAMTLGHQQNRRGRYRLGDRAGGGKRLEARGNA